MHRYPTGKTREKPVFIIAEVSLLHPTINRMTRAGRTFSTSAFCGDAVGFPCLVWLDSSRWPGAPKAHRRRNRGRASSLSRARKQTKTRVVLLLRVCLCLQHLAVLAAPLPPPPIPTSTTHHSVFPPSLLLLFLYSTSRLSTCVSP